MNTPEQQRYWLIELLAWWEGRVNTSDLIREFQISRQSASKSIKLYLALQPASLTYNSHQKAYQPTETFKPLYLKNDVAEYLEWATRHTSTLGLSVHLPYDTITLPPRHIQPEMMRQLVQAIREHRALEVDYVSLSNPDREGRILVPPQFCQNRSALAPKSLVRKKSGIP